MESLTRAFYICFNGAVVVAITSSESNPARSRVFLIEAAGAQESAGPSPSELLLLPARLCRPPSAWIRLGSGWLSLPVPQRPLTGDTWAGTPAMTTHEESLPLFRATLASKTTLLSCTGSGGVSSVKLRPRGPGFRSRGPPWRWPIGQRSPSTSLSRRPVAEPQDEYIGRLPMRSISRWPCKPICVSVAA